MVHLDRMLRVLWVAALLAAGTQAFIFGSRKTNCQVTEWGPWSTESFGFGQVSRERTIIRHPTNGGTDCPQEMEDIKISGRRATIQSTAKSMAKNFMVQNSPTLSAKTGNPTGQLRDLLIIMDASGSIGSVPYKVALDQLARLLGMLCPKPDPFKKYQQAAMITFSSRVKEIFDFNDKANTVAVQQGIKGAAYPGGGTNTAAAFKYARTNMLTTAKGMRKRKDVKQEVLILTDGRSNCGSCAIAAAKKLDKDAKVFGLMIGSYSEAGINELTQYVSYPKNQHLFTIDSVNKLSKLVDLVEEQLQFIPCFPFDI